MTSSSPLESPGSSINPNQNIIIPLVCQICRGLAALYTFVIKEKLKTIPLSNFEAFSFKPACALRNNLS